MSKTTISPLPEFLSGLDPIGRRLAGEGPEWLRSVRRDACERVAADGLPSVRDEEWRSTRLDALTGRRLVAPTATPTAPSSLPRFAALELGGPVLTFIDGRFEPSLSAAEPIEGLWLGRLDEAIAQHGARIEQLLADHPATAGLAFESLNDALFEDAVVAIVERGAQIEAPIHVRHIATAGSDPTALTARLLIVSEASSRAAIVESYGALDATRPYFTNAVTQVVVEDNARLDHYRVQLEGEAATHIGSCTSRQGRDSLYRGFNISFGARLTRMHVTGVLDGEGSDCQIYGLYVPQGEQHVDSHTILDHAKPHGDSRELYKGVLCDRGRSVFSGRIIVREDAQKTDAKQSNPNLLLSREALAQTRPQLEIYADDVRCTHGATVGEMDEDAIFYLRSRGIPESDARHLLIKAFTGEVSERIELEALREAVELEVAERLPIETI